MSIGDNVSPMPKGGVGCGTSTDNGANGVPCTMYLKIMHCVGTHARLYKGLGKHLHNFGSIRANPESVSAPLRSAATFTTLERGRVVLDL